MDAPDSSVAVISHVIQLAVAPVFLLSGVGITLTVLTNRLARMVDRARHVEALVPKAGVGEIPELQRELKVIALRARLTNRAITLCTICALLVSLVVIALFLNALLQFNLATPIAILFIVAMLSFVGALVYFLREVFIATTALRIGIDAST